MRQPTRTAANEVNDETKEVKTLTPQSGKMLDVIIALIPAAIAGVAVFGARAAIVIGVTVISSVIFEHLFCLLSKKPTTIGDFSAVVTGLLLSFSLPVRIPIPLCILGSALAIIALKLLFGGYGKNFLNPALTARAALFVAFTRSLTSFTIPTRLPIDAISTATPMHYLSKINLSGDISTAIESMTETGYLPRLVNMLFGVKAGCIGEVCAVALLLGGVYLILRGVISFVLPVSYIGAFAFTVLAFSNFSGMYTLYSLLSGGVLLGAFFMITDPVTAPDTTNKKLLFGTVGGILTALIRFVTPLAEGVTITVILMNLAVYVINNHSEIKTAIFTIIAKTKEFLITLPSTTKNVLLNYKESTEVRRQLKLEAKAEKAAIKAEEKAEKEEAARIAAEEARIAAEAEAARKAAEEEAARIAAEEEAARKAAEEEAARIAAKEEAARKAAEEEAARIAAEEEAARKAAEEEAARIAAEEEAARKAAEEEAARIAAEEEKIDAVKEAARLAAQEEAARIAEIKEAAKAAQEETAQIAAAEEAAKTTAAKAAPVLINELSSDFPKNNTRSTKNKKNKSIFRKKEKIVPDFSQPMPDVIPAFLAKEIEKQRAEQESKND